MSQADHSLGTRPSFTVSAPPTNVPLTLNLESEKRADVEKQATQDAWVLSEQIHSELHHVRHQ